MFSGWIKWRGVTLAFSTLANCLISFPGSLQVLSAIWLWAPGLCGKIHCHGDDEGHPGHPSETLPCADFARSVRWEDAEEKWLIFASRRDQRPAGNDFHPKKFRQVPRALKKFGQSLPQSTAQQYSTWEPPIFARRSSSHEHPWPVPFYRLTSCGLSASQERHGSSDQIQTRHQAARENRGQEFVQETAALKTQFHKTCFEKDKPQAKLSPAPYCPTLNWELFNIWGRSTQFDYKGQANICVPQIKHIS